MNQLLAAIVVLVAAIIPIASQGADGGGSDTAPGRVALAVRIGALVMQHFGHFTPATRAQFERDYAAYRQNVPSLSGRIAFDLATMQLISTLRNGHTQFWDTIYSSAHRWQQPFDLAWVEGRWVITRSGASGLRPGDVVLSIGNVPAERFYADHAPLIRQSSERETRQTLGLMIAMEYPAEIPLGLEDGRHVTVANVPGVTPNFRQPVTSRWLVPGRVGYVRIPEFGNPKSELIAAQAVVDMSAAKTIVFDVRGNGGGGTPSTLLSFLMAEPWAWWNESTSAPEPARAPANGGLRAPNPHHYTGNVIALVDEACASACEDFIMPLAFTRRAVLIGTPTYGSTGSAWGTDLGDGMHIRLGSIHASFPDGTPFEGVGIQPNILAPLTIADLRVGRDAALERAVTVATAQ